MEKNQNVISMKQAAKLSKCTVGAIFLAIKNKRLKATREGLRWWIQKEDLVSYRKNKYSRMRSIYQGKPLFDKEKGEYSITEAAKELGITVAMAYHYVRCKRFPFTRKGVSYVIQIEDVKRFKEELEKTEKLSLSVG